MCEQLEVELYHLATEDLRKIVDLPNSLPDEVDEVIVKFVGNVGNVYYYNGKWNLVTTISYPKEIFHSLLIRNRIEFSTEICDRIIDYLGCGCVLVTYFGHFEYPHQGTSRCHICQKGYRSASYPVEVVVLCDEHDYSDYYK